MREWRLQPHGTLARSRWHYRRGEKPCGACMDAQRWYYRLLRREQRARARQES